MVILSDALVYSLLSRVSTTQHSEILLGINRDFELRGICSLFRLDFQTR